MNSNLTTDRKPYLERLTIRAYSGSPWHSLLGAVKGVSDDVFFRVPERHKGYRWMDGSIRDIVFHVTGDKLVQLSAAFDGGRDNWDTVTERLSKNDKSRMFDELQEAHELQIDWIRKLPEERLNEQVATTMGVMLSAEDVFIMLIEHDLYHAGQIRYIRNVLE